MRNWMVAAVTGGSVLLQLCSWAPPSYRSSSGSLHGPTIWPPTPLKCEGQQVSGASSKCHPLEEINSTSAIRNTSDRDEERRHKWNLLKSLRGWRAAIAVICDLRWRDVWGKTFCRVRERWKYMKREEKKKQALRFPSYLGLLLMGLNQQIKTWRQTRHNVTLYVYYLCICCMFAQPAGFSY